MDIGQKLKEQRTARGFSQEQLADMLGVARQTIANWEKGKTYPDIGHILKLSDLYGISLDEFLKEDTGMRQHMEQSAPLPRRYWNLLFEAAILLLPFGSLAAYWHLPLVGTLMQVIGLLMLPPLWIARYKLFGMPREDLRKSITGWCLWVFSIVFDLLNPSSHVHSLLSSVLSIMGLMMIYGSGIYLERGRRFWLVIALYLGIPAYIYASHFLGNMADLGAFSTAQPFGSDYRIAEVEYGQSPGTSTRIRLENYYNTLYINDQNLGKFQYIEPMASQQDSLKGLWHLVPQEDPSVLYKLEVSTQDEIVISCLSDDQLQWRWEIKALPGVHFDMNTEQYRAAWEMDWFAQGTWDGDPTSIPSTDFRGDATICLQFHEDSVTALTLIEEYHREDFCETREYALQKDKNDEFPLPEPLTKRDDTPGAYILYRIPWDGGEYLFCINY